MESPKIRAAQYLRMSTEHQRYSLENQAAALAMYALQRDRDIVRTYTDAGKSGLTLKERAGLKTLLSDVVSSERDFQEVLVLDVSRWGRFQDPDQAAHYEFICREAGVAVRYCAETFENDGSLASSIMKQLKRIMAAEYSRDLGVKVSRGQRRVASEGYWTGAPAPFGFRRLLEDKHGSPRGELRRGESKAVATDRVRLIWGPPEEVEAVRTVFRLYARKGLNNQAVAEAMLTSGAAAPRRGWTRETVRLIIRNKLYAGVHVLGRVNTRLKGARRVTPKEEWLHVPVVEPIVPMSTFRRAQDLRALRQHHSDAYLLARLRKALRRHGYLSSKLIDKSPDLPNKQTYQRRFGGLNAAFSLAGYQIPISARRWKHDALLGHLRRLHEQHGHVSKAIVAKDIQAPGVRTYIRVFGSFDAAQRAAGLEPYQERIGSQERRWTEEELLEHLRQLHQTHGKVTYQALAADRARPQGDTYKRRFGSFDAAAKAAGLPHNPNYRGRTPKRDYAVDED